MEALTGELLLIPKVILSGEHNIVDALIFQNKWGQIKIDLSICWNNRSFLHFIVWLANKLWEKSTNLSSMYVWKKGRKSQLCND